MKNLRGLCPHPASGINESIIGYNIDADGINLSGVGYLIYLIRRIVILFYRYWVTLSSNRIINWFNTKSQFLYLWVHFFLTFMEARYNIFSRDSSVGNTLLVLVTFLYWRFSPSIMFVVYIILRISSVKWKKGLITSQLASQLLIAKGYFFPYRKITYTYYSCVSSSTSFLLVKSFNNV